MITLSCRPQDATNSTARKRAARKNASHEEPPPPKRPRPTLPRPTRQGALPAALPPVAHVHCYAMTSDVGMAPHMSEGLLSLALCKPRIRERARVGDYLLGFVGTHSFSERGWVRYIARVTEVVSRQRYYTDPQYSRRRDVIYLFVDGSQVHKGAPVLYHNTQKTKKSRAASVRQQRRDARGSVLLSTVFRVFPFECPHECPVLSKLQYHHVGQRHVPITRALQARLEHTISTP